MEYTAEIFDQMQFFYETNGFNDHQLHCVLRFERGPNPEVLKRSVIASIEAIPILGTRYIDGTSPRWTSLGPVDFGRAFMLATTKTEFEEFLVARVDESAGPQIRVCQFDSNPSAVALKMNHMICDAADFKQYLYFLCTIYSELTADPTYRPPAITGDRSIRGVLRRFPISVKVKSLLTQSKDNNQTGNQRFPLSESGDVRPFILTRVLERDRIVALKDYCRANGATLNDAVLTAYYRCLFQLFRLKTGVELQIPVMVDMRRYLQETEEFRSLTNLTSMQATRLDYKTGERFGGTLARVMAVMNEKKGADIGLNGFIKLGLLYGIFGDRIANRGLKSKLKQPLICMTNVGILDSGAMSFGNLRPYDAFVCGSIKYKPYFQIAMSSYDGRLTLSANQYGSAVDRDRIRSFLDEIEAELPRARRDVMESSSRGAQRRGDPKIVGQRRRPLDCFAPLAMTVLFPSQRVLV
jgi:NRPS condensation-like uncharacterized protein